MDEKLREDMFPDISKIPMDEVFTEMFGSQAETMYHYIGQSFVCELQHFPEDYPDKESKKHLIGDIIVQQFQIADSPFYE